MSHRAAEQTAPRARLVRWLLPVLPLLLGLACLWLLDTSDRTERPAVQTIGPRPDTRLVVILIDALDQRDVQAGGHMPKLRARLRGAGLHGPVRACVDAITIPCVTAMITGYDRASPFATARNFGAAGKLVERSVLGAFLQRGLRVGYFGEEQLAHALTGLTRVGVHQHGQPEHDDAETLRAALSALDGDRLDVVMVHLLAIDEAAHKHTIASPAYARAARGVDDLVHAASARLRPTDHIVVLGDHGHDEDGRHSAGVGTESYAVYAGPRFAATRQKPMAVTDHARIWAQLFGMRWAERSWIDDYFAQRDATTLATAPAVLSVRGRRLAPLALTLVLALVLASTHADLWRARAWTRRHVALALAFAALTLALGALWSALWPLIAQGWGAALLTLLLGGLGGVLIGVWQRGDEPTERSPLRRGLARCAAGALLLAPATMAPMVGLQVPVVWLMLACTTDLVRRGATARRLAPMLIILPIFGSLAWVTVEDYLPRSFPIFATVSGLLGPGLAVGMFMAAARWAGSLRSLACAALGGVLAGALSYAPDSWFLVPCALIVPLTFWSICRSSWFDLSCLVLPSAGWFFFERDATLLTPIAAVLLLWAVLPALLDERAMLLRAVAWVALMWLTFWTAMATRMGGVDYDFYFHWLPHDEPATSAAIQQALLTAAKCLLPVLFGAALARRAGALRSDTLSIAEHLVRMRLSLTFLFVIGVSLGRGQVDVHLLHDAAQEAAFWILMFGVLGIIALGRALAQRKGELS